MSVTEVLERIIGAFDEAGIAYMLTGSLASTAYGAARSTQDIDVVISASADEVRRFLELLPQDRYFADLTQALEALRRESMFNVIDLGTGWKIDLIIRKSRLFSQGEFERRRQISIDHLPVFVAASEDVVISKLEWSKISPSDRQMTDVAGILRIQGAALDYSYLQRWVQELGLDEQWTSARRLAGLCR
jgi:hypothetical protein